MASLKTRLGWMGDREKGNVSVCLDALAEIESLEKDAARYRWLRGTTNWASNSSGERIDVRNSPELWDSAIDEAIARTALLPDNAEISGRSSAGLPCYRAYFDGEKQ